MGGMDATPSELEEAVREAEEVRRLRARRDAALTPAERLERVHELCRQLAAIRPADEPPP
jgi:hypothetical protein